MVALVEIAEIFSHLIVRIIQHEIGTFQHATHQTTHLYFQIRCPLSITIAFALFSFLGARCAMRIFAVSLSLCVLRIKVYISIQLECDFTKIQFILTKLR